MIRKFVFIQFIILAIACKGVYKGSQQTMSSISRTSFVPTDSNQLYFPSAATSDRTPSSGLDSFSNRWYSAQLFALREPVLFADQSNDEIYRFTWLRTFHHPVAIRIERHDDSCNLFWKEGSGRGGYDPGTLMRKGQKKLAPSSWTAFKEALDGIDFWKLETTARVVGGLDGSEWILEGKMGDRYHVMKRWTPDQKSNYYKCGDFLIKLTDLRIDSTDKY